MPDYEKLYYKLFAVFAEVTEALEQQDYGTAKRLLIKAQQDAEDAFLEEE